MWGWIILILIVLLVCLIVRIILSKIQAGILYAIRQPMKAYEQFSKPGYRKTIIIEGTKEMTGISPYLLSGEKYDVDLSIVVPCYNETKRFPLTFRETFDVRRIIQENLIVFERFEGENQKENRNDYSG